jgi:hypothetical protein
LVNDLFGHDLSESSSRSDEVRLASTRTRVQSRFEATTIGEVTFTNDPAFQPGSGRQPVVDTVRFSGTGKWNGRSRYAFEIVATDQGEPGRHRDTLSLIVKDASGNIVANVSGSLDGGNIQSTRLGR